MNLYCILCFKAVRELRSLEFGLVFIQTIGDVIGAICYIIYIGQLYLQRFFFYCTMDYKTELSSEDDPVTHEPGVVQNRHVFNLEG